MGTPTLRLFLMAWVGSLALLVGLWSEGALPMARAGDRHSLIALGAVMALAPWLAGPGLLPLLRRMKSGGVNLPYAEYWFAGERRAASLERLRPYLEVFGALLAVFLGGVLLIFVGERTHVGVAAYAELIFLAATLAFLGGTVAWVRAVVRAFPAPDPATRGVSALRPARRRPGPHRPRPDRSRSE